MKRSQVDANCDCEMCRAQAEGDISKIFALMAYMTCMPPPRHGLEIESHISKFVGPLDRVLTSDAHDDDGAVIERVNLLLFPPSPKRNCWTLVTEGVSDLPLDPGEGSEVGLSWIEFVLSLPPDWKLDRDLCDGDRWDLGPNYWPIQLLVDLCSMPHLAGERLGFSHTVEFSDHPTVADGVRFNSVILLPSEDLPDEFNDLTLPGGKSIQFLNVVPLFPEELEMAKKEGSPRGLIDRLNLAGVTDLVHPGRPSCV